jgi:hypothetical protein
MKGVLCVVSWSGGALVYVGQDETRHDKTRQDKTRQDKTRQESYVCIIESRVIHTHS